MRYVGAYCAKHGMHLLQIWVIAMSATRLEFFLIDDIPDVGQYHHIANAWGGAIMQIGGNLVLAPYAGMGDVLQGKVDGIGVTRVGIDACRYFAYDIPHPLALQQMADLDGVGAVDPCHAMIGEHDEVHALVEMMVT